MVRVRAAPLLLALIVLVPVAHAGAPFPEVLVSRQLARARGLEPGDTIRLAPAAPRSQARTFRVAGVFEPTPDPMRLTRQRFEVRLHLADLAALAPDAADRVDAVRVRLRDPERAEGFARQVATRLPGLVVAPTASEERATPFVVLERFHLAIAIVTVLGSTAFLLALMIMRVEERRETVGILRTLGFARGRILTEVLLEGLFIGVLGAAFGVLFARALQGAVNAFFQWRYDTPLVFLRITPAIAAQCVALAVPLGVLAGVVASWTLLRRDPAALLRR